jgi:hypothetical protein
MVRKTLTLNPPAKSVAEWLERTGTNITELAAMVRAKGLPLTLGGLSNVLRRSRPCRLAVAIALSDITGVPVQQLVAWGKAKRYPVGETRTPKRRKSTKNEPSGAAA